MQPITSALINATSKAARFLRRDFVELELLQSSARDNKDFTIKSLLRTKDFLREELCKYAADLFFVDEKYNISPKADTLLLVDSIEGVSNLAKSLPFFAIAVCYFKKFNNQFAPICAVINLPVLGDLYYAEKGAGMWLERNASGTSNVTRLRVSRCSSLENAMVATIISAEEANIKTSLSNTRNFGSLYYHLALFASGKCDLTYYGALHNNDYPIASKAIHELVAQESGGMTTLMNNILVASSPQLIDKLQSLFA